MNGFGNLIGLAAGLLVLGLVCKVCGNMFEGEKGSKCPECGGASRASRASRSKKSPKSPKSTKTTHARKQKQSDSIMDYDFKIDL